MAMRGLISDYITAKDWGLMVGLYLFMNLLRFVGVVVFYPVLRRGSYGINWREALVLSYSGLRGAVGLTLAIAVHQDAAIPFPTRDRILFHVAGVSLLSLLVNGTTLKPLISFLGLDLESPAELEVYDRTSIAIEQRLEDRVCELQHEPFLGDADWGLVWRYLPVLTEDVYWHRFRQGHTRLTPWEAEYMTLRSEQAQGQGRGQGQADVNPAKAAATASKRMPRNYTRKNVGVPNRLRRTWRHYAQLYNELDGPEHEGMRQLRAGLLDAWRNHLLADEHLEHEQDEAAEQSTTVHQRRGSLEPAAFPPLGSLESLLAGESNSRPRLANVTVLWSPEVAGLKRETSSLLARQASFSNAALRARKNSLDSTAEPGPSRPDKRTSAADKGLPPSPLSKESLKRARVQVLTVLKHLYGANFHCGLLTNEGSQALEKNLYKLILDPGDELNEWRTLEQELWIPMNILQRAKRLKRSWIVGPLATSFMFSRLAFFFELAVNFVKAHRSLEPELPKILGPGPVAALLQQEVLREIEDAQRTISIYLPVFPETFNSVKTAIATSVCLHHFRSLLEESHEMGIMGERHYHGAIQACNDATNALSAHSHSESTPTYASVLSSVGFLRFLSPEQLDALFLRRKAGKRRLFADVYVKAQRKLLKRNAPGGGGVGGGWYVVVRGAVAAGEVTLPQGATLGLVELLLGDEVVDDYVTTTLTHLLYFDKAAMLQEAETNPTLLKSLWWYLAVHELHQHGIYAEMEIGEVGEVLAEASFVHVAGEEAASGDGAGSKVSGASVRLLNMASIRSQLEGMGMSGHSFRASTTLPGKSPRQEVLRVSGDGKDVLIMRGGVRGGGGGGTSTTPKGGVGGPRESRSFLASFLGGVPDRGSLALSQVPAPVATSSRTASAVASKPQLLARFQGELLLEPGTICFVICRPQGLVGGEAEGARMGMRKSATIRRRSVLSLSSMAPPPVAEVEMTALELPPPGLPVDAAAAAVAADAPEASVRASSPPLRPRSPLPSTPPSPTAPLPPPRRLYLPAQTVSLQDFLDSACGEIDVAAARQALARGETLASFLSRQVLAKEEGSGGGGGGGSREPPPGTPPSLKQRISSSVSSPLSGLFSSSSSRERPLLTFLKNEAAAAADSEARPDDEEGRGKRKQPTALELMFLEGGGGKGDGAGGGGEEHV